MLRQERSRLLDAVKQARGKIAALETSAHGEGDFSPESVAALLVHALVADDGECAGSGGHEDEDGVPMPRLVHSEPFEMAPGGRDRIGGPVTRNENPNFARGAFRSPGR